MDGRTEALFGMNEGKAVGWRGGQRDAPAVGGQDNTTASHMWAKGGIQAAGAAHSGIVIGGLDAADKVERNGLSHPSAALVVLCLG